MSATLAAPTSLDAAFAALGRGEPVLTVDDIDGTGTDMIVLRGTCTCRWSPR